ncbi:MAG TPA: hypothetical protein VN040_12255 [Pseudosphingobacterium sp.]|nr:hypothetical protein [Pseudosphingobacterium sp.]
MRQLVNIVTLLKAIYLLLNKRLENTLESKKEAAMLVRLYSRNAAADYLLVRPKTVTNWRKQGKLLPAKHPGKTPLYDQEELDRCYKWYWGRPKGE